MNKEFKLLAKDYFTQNNYGTAYPIYFVIRDVERQSAYHFEDGEEYVMVWDTEETHKAKTIKDLFRQLVNDKEKYGFEGLGFG